MSNKAEYMRALRAKKKAEGIRYDQRERKGRGNRHATKRDAPFIGVDGEGGNVIQDVNGNWIDDPDASHSGNRSHRYLLLRAGKDNVLMNDDRSPLSSLQCLTFLANLPWAAKYVAYYFNYDVTMILRDLPIEKLKELKNREARKYQITDHNGELKDVFRPVSWEGFEFDYLPSKFFEIRNAGEKAITIEDQGPFYQAPFLKALQQWKIGTAEDYVNIGEGKAGRVNYGALTDETIAYNKLECELLEKLVTAFVEACKAVQCVPKRLQGPGYMAAALMEKNNVIRTEDLKNCIPDDLAEAARQSYFGGRFEVTALGHIPGPVYQHDINSAYPHSETMLPCLICGNWDYQETDTLPDTDIYLAYGSFDVKDKPYYLYGFPVRKENGNIFYPGSGEGWYWSYEIRTAIHQTFTPQKVWAYQEMCSHSPWEWMKETYNYRAVLGKDGKGMVIKLAANSTYGKQCQSIGNPVYANPVCGSMITSMTRAQLYTKALKLSQMGEVVMLATDGIFTTSPIDRNHSPVAIRDRLTGEVISAFTDKKDKPSNIPADQYELKPLGDWDVECYTEGIFIIQPGLYLLPGNKKPKTRGLPQNKVVEYHDEFLKEFDLWKAGKGPGCVHVSIRCFITLKQAAARNNKTYMGQWVELYCERCTTVGKHISFNGFTTKRETAFIDRQGVMRLRPYQIGCVSKPYSKDIGAWFSKNRELDTNIPDIDSDSPEVLSADDEPGTMNEYELESI